MAGKSPKKASNRVKKPAHGSTTVKPPAAAERGKDYSALLGTLKTRFEQNMGRHKGLRWADVSARLEAHPQKLDALLEMERTGGEPDVIGVDSRSSGIVFCDCSAETPKGRRSVCYDREGQQINIKGRPNASHNAVDMAAAMGVELLTEDQYRELQMFGEFDTKTSSWVKTPAAIRQLGGALFCDCRYDQVFVYHNGAHSYYSARAFRARLTV